jgi:enterochelin esterase-like enzyme
MLAIVATAWSADALTYTTLDSPAEHRPMTYGTWTPPGWDGHTPLPVVLFLHGGGDRVTAFDDHPAALRGLAAWVAEGRLPPFLLVVPQGDRGFWRNWADGAHHYADWVMDDVLGDVATKFPIVPADQGGLHGLGISMGGAGTMMLGIDHLDRFASLSVLSAPLFTSEEALAFLDRGYPGFDLHGVFGHPTLDEVRSHNPYDRLQSADALGPVKLVLARGTMDMPGIGPSTDAFHIHLAAASVPHTYFRFAGGHLWSSWKNAYPVALCVGMGGERCFEDAPGVSEPL